MLQTLVDNRYTLGDLLGRGGMAEVYLAHDEVLDRDVALKVLRDQYAENEEFVERFRDEARNAAFLIHPNIVTVYDWGRCEDGTYYIAMEHVPGGTLKDRILSDGSLDPNAVIELASQVARALGHAHEHGVIHRDVKSHNILLADTGYAKVTDFGIARAATATTTTSRASIILGTASYMSPEQAMGKRVDPRGDLYSLGVVLYEMLTGTLPYNGEDPVNIALKHLDEPPRSPREANPNVPEPLDALTTRLLAKNPEDRYRSAVELADDLERVRSDLSPLAVSMEKKTEIVTAPLLATGEKRPKKTAVQTTAATPMEVFESGRRQGGRLFRILALLLFSAMVLGGLAWALMQDPSSAQETSSPEGTSDAQAATPSTGQVPNSAQETSSPEDTSGTEDAIASTVQGLGSTQETSGPDNTPDTENVAPSTVQVPALYYASEAEGVLTAAGLKLGSRNEASNDTVPAGIVVEQNPAAGTTVEEGTAVDIVVSTGPKQAPTAVQATPTGVGAVSRQASTTQAVSTTAQTAPAPTVNNKTVGKEQKGKKKGKK